MSELTADVWLSMDLLLLLMWSTPHVHARTNCSGGGLSNCSQRCRGPQLACLPFPSADGAVLAVLVTQ